MDNREELLSVKNLTVQYETVDGIVHAVTDVNLSIGYGETLGLVGETGAGKTTTVKTIMRILPDPPAKVKSGEIILAGENLMRLNSRQMAKVRGSQVSMIFQDPMTSLNPVMTVVDQIDEAIRIHGNYSKKESHERACQMLEMVGIRRERKDDYPHQFSGGMKQRVVIAMALACNPKLLIADEPTTALDVTIQAQVLELMKELKETYKMSLILITHDLGIVAETCDKVAIMYAGEIVEYGDAEHIFNTASHPYTIGLFNCIPSLTGKKEKLTPIIGLMPDPSDLPTGCKFHPRCYMAQKACAEEKQIMRSIQPRHAVRCWLADKGSMRVSNNGGRIDV